jgi:hypothetical protein
VVERHRQLAGQEELGGRQPGRLEQELGPVLVLAGGQRDGPVAGVRDPHHLVEAGHVGLLDRVVVEELDQVEDRVGPVEADRRQHPLQLVLDVDDVDLEAGLAQALDQGVHLLLHGADVGGDPVRIPVERLRPVLAPALVDVLLDLVPQNQQPTPRAHDWPSVAELARARNGAFRS